MRNCPTRYHRFKFYVTRFLDVVLYRVRKECNAGSSYGSKFVIARIGSLTMMCMSMTTARLNFEDSKILLTCYWKSENVSEI